MRSYDMDNSGDLDADEFQKLVSTGLIALFRKVTA